MRITGIVIALVIAASQLAVPRLAAAVAVEFVVRPGGANRVVFVSKASMERFEGTTSRIDGRIVVDPAAVGDSATVHFEVDLASLDTGIKMRNRHMRENHLETATYPKATFDGVLVSGPSGAVLAPGSKTPLDVEGTFTLHGVSRRIRIRVEVTYTPRGAGGSIAFRTQFPVLLSDYKISRPQFLFLKLAETQDVQVRGVATTAP